MKITMYVYGDGSPLKVEPRKMVIDEAEGMHDLATLSFGSDYGVSLVSRLNLGNVDANDLGPPAAIEVIVGNTLLMFYGYVDTTVQTQRRTDDALVDVYFLSCSSSMRSGKPRVWRDKLPFKIAGDLLAPYGLGLEMDKISTPMASFAQSDESDWEALRRLAILNGLSLTASGPIVKLKDVINETRRARGSASTLRFHRPGSQSRGLECREFTQTSSRTPVGGERYRYYGIDQLGASFEVTGGVSTVEKSAGVVVRSLGTALREARRHLTIGRFVTRATLEAPGVAGCSAGECIIVDKDVNFPEYWYITSSKHTFITQKDEWGMSLELCQQEGITPGYVSTAVPRRPGAVLIGKAWRCDRSWRLQL